jgi:hypothetical protein
LLSWMQADRHGSTAIDASPSGQSGDFEDQLQQDRPTPVAPTTPVAVTLAAPQAQAAAPTVKRVRHRSTHRTHVAHHKVHGSRALGKGMVPFFRR